MMKTNLNAWLILAVGVSSPSAATNGSSTNIAKTTAVEVDNNHIGMMNQKSPSSTSARHRRPNLRHDKYAYVKTKSNNLHHLHTTVLGSNVEQTRRHLEEVLPQLEYVGNPGPTPLGNW